MRGFPIFVSLFLSPLHLGIPFKPRDKWEYRRVQQGFSPLFIGASRSTSNEGKKYKPNSNVSVPSSLGHRVQQILVLGINDNLAGFMSPLHWGLAYKNYRFVLLLV